VQQHCAALDGEINWLQYLVKIVQLGPPVVNGQF